jgi:DNA-binding protein HU-beta
VVSRRKLVPVVAKALSVRHKDAERLFVAVFAAIKQGLQKDGRFLLVDFGTFVVHNVSAYMGTHPITGERISIAASKKIKFRPGLGLKNLVNYK